MGKRTSIVSGYTGRDATASRGREEIDGGDDLLPTIRTENLWSRGSARSGGSSSVPVPSFAGGSSCASSNKASSSIAAGIRPLTARAPAEGVGDMLAPGGDFDEQPEHAGVSMYRTDYHGRQYQQVVGGPGGDQVGGPAPVSRWSDNERVRTRLQQRTHDRCIAHMEPSGCRQPVVSTYTSNTATRDQLARRIDASRQAKGLSQEEHEARWRSWQQRQRLRGDCGGELDGKSETVSVMPAGQRVAKCIDDIVIGGVMLPLFGEDRPIPSWTTLSSAPWVGREGKRQATTMKASRFGTVGGALTSRAS
eukprot:TRINITY_DN61493_c0_g1_i1.p1 TRINITY_DN61493_c0_g1~~TRINITY_DN61493_c0_g1_i1.p1  ORF type:complete len:307 (-),score=44.12 TRINITY_DN61493_c0_g1_i1:168-1088(-)